MKLTASQIAFLTNLLQGRYVPGRGLRVTPLRENGLIAFIEPGRWVITEEGRKALL